MTSIKNSILMPRWMVMTPWRELNGVGGDIWREVGEAAMNDGGTHCKVEYGASNDV